MLDEENLKFSPYFPKKFAFFTSEQNAKMKGNGREKIFFRDFSFSLETLATCLITSLKSPYKIDVIRNLTKCIQCS